MNKYAVNFFGVFTSWPLIIFIQFSCPLMEVVVFQVDGNFRFRVGFCNSAFSKLAILLQRVLVECDHWSFL